MNIIWDQKIQIKKIALGENELIISPGDYESFPPFSRVSGKKGP